MKYVLRALVLTFCIGSVVTLTPIVLGMLELNDANQKKDLKEAFNCDVIDDDNLLDCKRVMGEEWVQERLKSQ